MAEQTTNSWIFLCNLDVIPEGKSKGFILEGHKLFAVQQRGVFFLYRNSCPHLGIPLEWVDDQFLDASGSMIQCANHGALFVIGSGKCVSGPCAGRKLQALDIMTDNHALFVSRAALFGRDA
jgi:nitrite reductase/ring-hydroxylating ferredoxin subunit